MVDEFQDVNLVQSELLDPISYPERNYMAIGDDDQTIYEWRGASPRFTLGFAERYRAKTYLISDNFRSNNEHLLLANRVIEQNKARYPKLA
ncbi:MAG: UvrD-helicase domain-containing protein [Deinococcales bacterium]